jgi:hypothetical protein
MFGRIDKGENAKIIIISNCIRQVCEETLCERTI